MHVLNSDQFGDGSVRFFSPLGMPHSSDLNLQQFIVSSARFFCLLKCLNVVTQICNNLVKKEHLVKIQGMF
jgi:hypothetical protein